MNNVTLTGRLTKDAELRKTAGGATCATFTLAVNRRFQTADGVEADFISIVCWGKLAENVNTYTRKGMMVGIVGRIQTRTYERGDGSTAYVTEVVANEVQFLDRKVETKSADDRLNANLEDIAF